MRGFRFFVCLVALALLAPVAHAVPDAARRARVTHVSDGDTAYLRPLRYGTTASSWDWRKGRLFNAVLVRRGLATVEIYEPNDRYERRLRRLQAAARRAERGLWGPCR